MIIITAIATIICAFFAILSWFKLRNYTRNSTNRQIKLISDSCKAWSREWDEGARELIKKQVYSTLNSLPKAQKEKWRICIEKHLGPEGT